MDRHNGGSGNRQIRHENASPRVEQTGSSHPATFSQNRQQYHQQQAPTSATGPAPTFTVPALASESHGIQQFQEPREFSEASDEHAETTAPEGSSDVLPTPLRDYTFPLLSLPGELVMMVYDQLDLEGKCAFRATCRVMQSMSYDSFFNEVCEKLHVVVHPISMNMLESIAAEPRLAAKVTKVRISTYMLRGHDVAPPYRQEYERLCAEEEAIIRAKRNTPTYCLIFLRCLLAMPNLDTVIVSDGGRSWDITDELDISGTESDQWMYVFTSDGLDILGRHKIETLTHIDISEDLFEQLEPQDWRYRQRIFIEILPYLALLAPKEKFNLDVVIHLRGYLNLVDDWGQGIPNPDIEHITKLINALNHVAPLIRDFVVDWHALEDSMRITQAMLMGMNPKMFCLRNSDVLDSSLEFPYPKPTLSNGQPVSPRLKHLILDSMQVKVTFFIECLVTCNNCTYIELSKVILFGESVNSNFIGWQASFRAMQRMPLLDKLRLHALGHFPQGEEIPEQAKVRVLALDYQIPILLTLLIDDESRSWIDMEKATKMHLLDEMKLSDLGHSPGDPYEAPENATFGEVAFDGKIPVFLVALAADESRS
ncbi:hypothetical protein DM02DRAFT_647717 [Periconia macrospinosa]|uniref:F-box domain-containing protein n=1 Tax=Periconia macrospinosa TaxID=97972 RepID=A0A2V1EE40_9PLEO|nr:hypothetical protein DM02DRAFT_647717 [Periconia macrospinosa]